MVRTFFLAMVAAAAVGCVGGPKLAMNPNQPIEDEYGYKQAGEYIDRASMEKVLERQPRSAGAMNRAHMLRTLTAIIVGAGGLVAGIPIAQAAMGQRPTMELAAAGGGAIGFGIVTAIWGANSIDDAVEAHNSGFPEYGSDPDR